MRPPLFVLYVADQSRSAAFYRAVLQREPSLDVPGMTQFALGEGALLGLMPEAGIERLLGFEVGPPRPRAELYLVVPDAKAAHERALQAGARELSPLSPRNWGDLAAYSQDPDGHVLALAQGADQDEVPAS